MLSLITIRILLILPPVVFGKVKTINLRKLPLYLQEYANSSIDYETCDPTDPHDYYDPDYGEEQCYYKSYKTWRSIEEEFPGVRSCCPFHGHISRADCRGRDRNRRETKFEKAEVCLRPAEGEATQIAGKINLKCRTENEILKGVYWKIWKHKGVLKREAKLIKVNDNKQVLQIGETKYTNFCFGIKCDSNGENFEIHYEACERKIVGKTCCGNITLV